MSERAATPTSPSAVPAEICGYTVHSVLTPGQGYLAIGPGGRGVVLKKLDPDCLLGGLLHPSIRERLLRVRELAHPGVANLHGVGRDGEDAYLIWEHIDGKTFDEYASTDGRTPRDLLVIARELILSVDSLHMQGIVHGAIGGGNVIVAPDGSVRLTQISPLLYSDVSVDIEAVIALLEQAVQQRGERGSPLGQLLAEADAEQMELRTLGTRVAALLEGRDETPPPQVRAQERHLRRRILIAAVILTALGLGVGYLVWRAVEIGLKLHTSPP